MSIKDYTDKTLELECDCGCSLLQVSYFFDDDPEIIVSHYISSWYANSHSIRKGLGQTFKMIWCAITGKRYQFYEIVIGNEQLEEFKKFVTSL